MATVTSFHAKSAAIFGLHMHIQQRQ